MCNRARLSYEPETILTHFGADWLAVLAADDHERWLRGSYDDVVALQRPYVAEQMTVRGPVFPTRNGSHL